jgi:hypothetical protein
MSSLWLEHEHAVLRPDLKKERLMGDYEERIRRDGWNAAIEVAAQLADKGMLVPPDGGSPTPDEIRVAEDIAAGIRKLKYRSA